MKRRTFLGGAAAALAAALVCSKAPARHDGFIGGVTFWDRPLSATEVQNLAEGTVTAPWRNPVDALVEFIKQSYPDATLIEESFETARAACEQERTPYVLYYMEGLEDMCACLTAAKCCLWRSADGTIAIERSPSEAGWIHYYLPVSGSDYLC